LGVDHPCLVAEGSDVRSARWADGEAVAAGQAGRLGSRGVAGRARWEAPREPGRLRRATPGSQGQRERPKDWPVPRRGQRLVARRRTQCGPALMQATQLQATQLQAKQAQGTRGWKTLVRAKQG
jgi:hypothetical protein